MSGTGEKFGDTVIEMDPLENNYIKLKGIIIYYFNLKITIMIFKLKIFYSIILLFFIHMGFDKKKLFF